ncbi:hypothetical protein C8Q77DRAFT_1152965 [Trametes polyzona]|nr:hypothetical protein C8Q77DRAFT_1152965 [Trametes polyzona]
MAAITSDFPFAFSAAANPVHIVSKPAGGDARVKSGMVTIYFFYAAEAFYAAVDSYLVEAVWVKAMTLENSSDVAQQYSHKYTTHMNITQGAEVTESVPIGTFYDGLSLTLDGTTKAFSAAETNAELTTQTVTIDIPAKSKAVFYQRRYTFRSAMFFILDAGSKLWTAGTQGGKDVARKECTIEIMSTDFVVVPAELDDTAEGTVEVATVPRGKVESDNPTRARENLTTRARAELTKMGI